LKTRLAVFFLALLLLPQIGLWLSGMEPASPLVDNMAEIVNPPAVLLTTLLFSGYVLLIHHLVSCLPATVCFSNIVIIFC